VPITESDTPIN